MAGVVTRIGKGAILSMYLAAHLVQPSHAAMVLAGQAEPDDDRPVTIVALGDSLVQGYGLYFEDGFTRQLEDWLHGQGESAVVVNAGVSGDTTAGGLARIGWTLAADDDGDGLRDVEALIVVLGGNDMLRGLDPEDARQNLRGILEAASAEGLPVLLAGLMAPANYGPEYQMAFEAVYSELAEDYGAVFVADFLAAIEEGISRQDALGRFMQADGLHPNADGVARIVEGIGPRVLDLVERARKRRSPETGS
ncbi:MAG: arylesterase [Paracoccaceae bacterium]|nr:arylesterase [Paracoccaceae bacterium]MDE2913279.1 arylesterase [Paracoccaceae bacterium]